MAAAEDMPRVVGVLSTLLERATERNDAAAAPAPGTTSELAWAFRSRARTTTRKPDISVRAYMACIARFADCSPACFVAAYIYLDRLRLRRRVAVDSYTVHRLLIAAVLAAIKFMDEKCYAYFARVGGISLPEMNQLELDFLFGVGFHLRVSPEMFGHYCDFLRSEMQCLELERLSLALPASEDDDGSGSSSQQRQQLDA